MVAVNAVAYGCVISRQEGEADDNTDGGTTIEGGCRLRGTAVAN